ncbi:MAG: UDP-N-acetylglucosamine--N-acetylmuramyl-(pentapeptide) pyrophosphoryl-undecaprenol N-acetylglucosamine transferase [Anaerolineales bacterium]
MRLLICAGGTGGGVYPALAVLQRLIKDDGGKTELDGEPSLGTHLDEILWVGVEGGLEADLVTRVNVPYVTISSAGVHGVGLKALPGNLLRLFKGFFMSLRVLNRFQPDVMLFTGGYIAVPMAIAGRIRRMISTIPKSVLYVPDIEPGLALKTIARFADRIAVTAHEAKHFFSFHKNVNVTGYPVRNDLNKWSSIQAREVFGLQDGLKTLLVFGGSQGARSINRALLEALQELLAEIQIIHICGSQNWSEVLEKVLSMNLALIDRYHLYPYLYEEMGAALTVADLVISRAGAATLGEFPLFGLPAILVPYPHAWHYQKINAQYLAQHGAAIKIKDEELKSSITSSVLNLINDSDRLNQMSVAMQSLASPGAVDRIANILITMAVSNKKFDKDL